jgi:hypothetical protein
MQKPKIILITACVLVVCVFIFLLTRTAEIVPFSEKTFDDSKQHRMVIFVHGTFGALVGLASAPAVWTDSLKGTIYKRFVAFMRRKNFFYASQPLLGLGLIGLQPSLEKSSGEDKFAARPIARCYQECVQFVRKADEICHYYTFGWNGLLSQKSRRKASVRLLNQLHQEVLKFKQFKIVPKITLLCHSHGGNVALNMGILVYLLRKECNEVFDCVKASHAVKKNEELLSSLPDFFSLKQQENSWMYRPFVPGWNIDELVLLATPLQEETDAGAVTSFFNRVDSFYSFDDHIQTKDVISTQSAVSTQRFTEIEEILEKKGVRLPDKIRQIRVMYNRAFSTDGARVVPKIGFLTDPGHKDFWFLMYPLNFRTALLRPLPLVCLYPLMSKILDMQSGMSDIDLNIFSKKDSLGFSVQQHDSKEVVACCVEDRQFFDQLRRFLYGWRQRGLIYQLLGALYLA